MESVAPASFTQLQAALWRSLSQAIVTACVTYGTKALCILAFHVICESGQSHELLASMELLFPSRRGYLNMEKMATQSPLTRKFLTLGCSELYSTERPVWKASVLKPP